MAIRNELSFIGTGKPMRVNVNPRLDREPLRRGVMLSGIETRREFNQVIKSEIVPNTKELGQAAVKLQNQSGFSVNVKI
ncbi:hypothetical protein ACFL6I_08130 [candidate division KSB1 bacterium]